MLRRMFMQGTAVLATALCGMRSRTPACSLEFRLVNEQDILAAKHQPNSTLIKTARQVGKSTLWQPRAIVTVTGSVEELNAFGCAYQESLWPEWKEEVAIIEASPAGRVSRIGKESLCIHNMINNGAINGELNLIVNGQKYRDAFQVAVIAVPGSLAKVPNSVRQVVGLPFKSLGPMSSVGYMNHAPRYQEKDHATQRI